jgi:hypothetical protein
VLLRGGRVTINAVVEARTGVKWLSATLQTLTGQFAAHVDVTEKTTSEPLAPGRYIVLVNGDGVAAASRECEVKDGETTTLRFDLARGSRRSVELHQPNPNSWSTVDVVVIDAQGQRAWSMLGFTRRDEAESHIVVCLGRGVWTLEAKTDTGLTARATVQVTELAEVREPIVLDLH